MTRQKRSVGREAFSLMAGIAVETAYVLGLSALGCLVCALAVLLAR